MQSIKFEGARITYTRNGEGRYTGTVRDVIRRNHRPVYLIAERPEEVDKSQIVEIKDSDQLRREMIAILLPADVLANLEQSERSVRRFEERNAPYLKPAAPERKPEKVGRIRI